MVWLLSPRAGRSEQRRQLEWCGWRKPPLPGAVLGLVKQGRLETVQCWPASLRPQKSWWGLLCLGGICNHVCVWGLLCIMYICLCVCHCGLLCLWWVWVCERDCMSMSVVTSGGGHGCKWRGWILRWQKNYGRRSNKRMGNSLCFDNSFLNPRCARNPKGQIVLKSENKTQPSTPLLWTCPPLAQNMPLWAFHLAVTSVCF